MRILTELTGPKETPDMHMPLCRSEAAHLQRRFDLLYNKATVYMPPAIPRFTTTSTSARRFFTRPTALSFSDAGFSGTDPLTGRCFKKRSVCFTEECNRTESHCRELRNLAERKLALRQNPSRLTYAAVLTPVGLIAAFGVAHSGLCDPKGAGGSSQ